MTYQLKKAWSDVVSGGSRSLLLVFALALGVWGLGTVAVSAVILGPDLRANFLGTEPPHAVVTLAVTGSNAGSDTASVDVSMFGALVETAEFRDLKLLRIEVRPDEWIPLWLFGVDDLEHQKLAFVKPEAGSGFPAPGTILIERDGLLISDLKAGSLAKVRSGERNLEVSISGIAFDPAQAPATQDHFIYAYTDRATWSSITGLKAEQRLLLRFPGVNSRDDVAAALTKLNLPPDAGVVIPPFLEHPHQWQLDLLLGIIGAIGFLSFLLSAVMVGQVVSALLSRQVKQVGILKAVGASPSRISGLYALYLLTLASVAGLASVPLAVVTGQAFARFVAGILNFNVLTAELPAATWAFLIVVALILPFVFAAPTLVRAGRISVREALSDASVSPPSQGLSRGSWPLRNLLRRPGRTFVVVATTALGVAIFSTGFNIRESLAQFLGATSDAMRFDLQVVLSEPVAQSRLLAPFGELKGIARTEFWTGGRGRLQTLVAQAAGGVGVVSLPFDTTMAVPRMSEGTWLRSAEAPEVVVNQAGLVALANPRLGDEVSILMGATPRRVRIIGIAEEIDNAKVYLSQTLWTKWADPERRANTLTLVASDHSYAGVMALKKELEKAGAASDLKILYIISQAERTKIIADHLDIILTVLLLLAFLVLWVAALGTAAASSITVMERTREIGVLRAIGAGPRRIVGLFVAEGMITAVAGLALGLLAAWPLSLVASSFFGNLMLGEGAELRFAWNPAGTLITVAVTLVFGWLANRAPAKAATKISTRRALAYE